MADEQLVRIASKIQQLLKRYEQLEKENERLQKDLNNANEKLVAHDTNIQALEQTVAVLKTVSGNMDETNKRALEKRLNQYLKEIDRCITMLSD